MKNLSKKTTPPKKVTPSNVVKKTKNNSWILVLGIINILAFIAMIIINYLATSLPIGGMTTWALSDFYPNLFTPAGLTFSIWGLIYLGLLGFVVRQCIDLLKKKSLGITKKVGIRFLLSCMTNIGWIFARHHQQVFLSVLILLAFLIVLIVLGNRVSLWQKIWTRTEKILVQIPFSIYLGRISVAIIANISARLVHIWRGMRGMTDIFWTMLVIIVATIIAVLQLRKHANIIFALVVIRAFIGIIIKRIAVDPIYAMGIIWLLGVCIAILSLGIWLKWKQRKDN